MVFSLQIGQKTDIDIISLTLTELGYTRTNNAQNYGDYAVRGDIIDIANVDHETGYRIDIFGDTIEKIKQFSLSSQVSDSAVLKNIQILPTDEVIMNEQTIKTFINKTKNTTNLMHLSIIDGIKIMNYIHYLPYFYEKPSTFFNYIKTPFQTIATTNSFSLFTILQNEININYQHSQNDNYNKYSYPEPKISFKCDI
jgi:transcription-repair coupling factor (superfamily II helicase)